SPPRCSTPSITTTGGSTTSSATTPRPSSPRTGPPPTPSSRPSTPRSSVSGPQSRPAPESSRPTAPASGAYDEAGGGTISAGSLGQQCRVGDPDATPSERAYDPAGEPELDRHIKCSSYRSGSARSRVQSGFSPARLQSRWSGNDSM